MPFCEETGAHRLGQRRSLDHVDVLLPDLQRLAEALRPEFPMRHEFLPSNIGLARESGRRKADLASRRSVPSPREERRTLMNDDPSNPAPSGPGTVTAPEPEPVRPMRHSVEDRRTAEQIPDTPQTRSPSYRLAYADEDFLLRPELRPVRLQLELLKPQLMLDEEGVETTIVLFGGARISEPARASEARTRTLAELSRFYEEARRFAHLATEASLIESRGRRGVIVTGGGPASWRPATAAPRGRGPQRRPQHRAPARAGPEPLRHARARLQLPLLRAPEDALPDAGRGDLHLPRRLRDAGRDVRVADPDPDRPHGQAPFLLFGRAFWESIIDWDALAERGTISPEDLDLFVFVETADEALEAIRTWGRRTERREALPGRQSNG
jgi:predicted Rossmann-fold nucleotide-binding protein